MRSLTVVIISFAEFIVIFSKMFRSVNYRISDSPPFCTPIRMSASFLSTNYEDPLLELIIKKIE